MKRDTCSTAPLLLLMTVLLLASRADAACVKVDSDELIEYSCEGGTTADLSQIPDNVEKIRISHMPIGRLTESLFSRFGNYLVVLSCSHCQITDIDDNALRRLQNLQQLSLDNNRLTEIRGTCFQGLASLTYLDLNYNDIERIDGDLFRHTPELVDLRVSGNRLVCLDIESMSRLRDLKRIFLNENPNFACPNAVKRFLNERNVDFEVDPQWNAIIVDRVNANEPVYPSVPVDEPRYPEEPESPEQTERPTPPPFTRPRWTEPAPTTTTTTTTTPPPPPPPPQPTYRVQVPEMIQPHTSDPEFPYQGPYYTPRVPQQELGNYRNNDAQQQVPTVTKDPRSRTSEMTESPTSPKVLIAGQMPPSTTTECPNAAYSISRGPSLIIGFALFVAGTAAIF